jgi:hypothetical protein
MVMRKLLVFSLIAGFLLTSALGTYIAENPVIAGIGMAAANIIPGNSANIASFSMGTVIVYLIVVVAIYLFGRSVIKSFGG